MRGDMSKSFFHIVIWNDVLDFIFTAVLPELNKIGYKPLKDEQIGNSITMRLRKADEWELFIFYDKSIITDFMVFIPYCLRNPKSGESDEVCIMAVKNIYKV